MCSYSRSSLALTPFSGLFGIVTLLRAKRRRYTGNGWGIGFGSGRGSGFGSGRGSGPGGSGGIGGSGGSVTLYTVPSFGSCIASSNAARGRLVRSQRRRIARLPRHSCGRDGALTGGGRGCGESLPLLARHL